MKINFSDKIDNALFEERMHFLKHEQFLVSDYVSIFKSFISRSVDNLPMTLYYFGIKTLKI